MYYVWSVLNPCKQFYLFETVQAIMTNVFLTRLVQWTSLLRPEFQQFRRHSKNRLVFVDFDRLWQLHRFTVTVESENKKNGIHTGASIITRPLRSSAETAERGDAVVGSQPDTWLHDAGWRRKRSLAQLTREALPRMENYRNSKRALKRPSLGELHGDNLITEEVLF